MTGRRRGEEKVTTTRTKKKTKPKLDCSKAKHQQAACREQNGRLKAEETEKYEEKRKKKQLALCSANSQIVLKEK